ncbi:hypothetical protein QBC47DRAFT_394778 [Echria macrotheca]|uniref:CENP-V/GFA domain-containing protein n=1 Tax=Echria macrotheca TaxID=438768 RepID=A0AAJ0F6H8_9PEZI|nr:hypothetical protein QBC47DRAFT_394778 [Echria macrotheca]
MTTVTKRSAIGNCHCGCFRFQISIDDKTNPISCTCTLCRKKGYIWLVADDHEYKVVRDDGRLTDYRTNIIQDQFCNKCGTGVVAKHPGGPLAGRLLVNARTIQGLNPFELESRISILTTDDNDMKLAGGIQDSGSSSDSVKHKGSCHCGQVWVELLAALQDLEVKEDNCSLCVRNAFIGVYPSKEEVRIHGRENTFEYKCGRKFIGTLHCSTCGVTVFTNVYGPPLSVFDRVPPERKEVVMAAYRKNMNIQPLNVRALEDVDLAMLQIKRSDEGTEGYTLED